MEVQVERGIKRVRTMREPDRMNRLIKNAYISKEGGVKDGMVYLAAIKHRLRIESLFPYYKDMELNPTQTSARALGFETNLLRCYEIKDECNMELIHGKHYENVTYQPVYINPKFLGTDEKTWAYDINSAFPTALAQPIPDINNPLGPGFIEKGQIGFRHDYRSGGVLVRVLAGRAEERYNLIESPYRKKVLELFDKRKRALFEGDIDLADDIKSGMVFAIGNLRNKSPHLWCHIISNAIDNVFQYFDEETTSMVNTDCIYSTVPRTDIPIGFELGQFKPLSENGTRLYIKGTNMCQWEGGKSIMSGIPKELQSTLDLRAGEQKRKPDFKLSGGFITNYEN